MIQEPGTNIRGRAVFNEGLPVSILGRRCRAIEPLLSRSLKPRGAVVRACADRARVSSSTIYSWLRRGKIEGPRGLLRKSRCDRGIPRPRTLQSFSRIKEFIQRTRWGGWGSIRREYRGYLLERPRFPVSYETFRTLTHQLKNRGFK